MKKKTYTEILNECYEAINSFDISKAENIYSVLLDDEIKLTKQEKQYIMSKVSSFRHYFYEKYLSDYILFSSLNNNYITPSSIRKACFYVKFLPQDEQGKWISLLSKRLKHSKCKCDKNDYADLLSIILSTIFPYVYEV